MNWKRTATLGLVGGTLVTLLARASTSVVPSPASSPASDVSMKADHQAFIAEVDRLRDRVRARVTPTAPSRNLFEFRSGARPHATAPTLPEPTAMPTPPAPKPPLVMLGLAEERGPDGPVRTAILSDADGLHFVKVGDAVANGYRVTAIREDAVELSGPADPPRLVLTLK